MNDLQLEIRAFTAIRIGIGTLSILAGVANFLYYFNELKTLPIILSIIWIILGLQLLTNHFGANKILVKTTDSGLEIRWAGYSRYRIIEADKIESISISRYYITINRKNERPVMLGLRNFEVSQKTMAYDYFSEIAKRYHIRLIRT